MSGQAEWAGFGAGATLCRTHRASRASRASRAQPVNRAVLHSSSKEPGADKQSTHDRRDERAHSTHRNSKETPLNLHLLLELCAVSDGIYGMVWCGVVWYGMVWYDGCAHQLLPRLIRWESRRSLRPVDCGWLAALAKPLFVKLRCKSRR